MTLADAICEDARRLAEAARRYESLMHPPGPGLEGLIGALAEARRIASEDLVVCARRLVYFAEPHFRGAGAR